MNQTFKIIILYVLYMTGFQIETVFGQCNTTDVSPTEVLFKADGTLKPTFDFPQGRNTFSILWETPHPENCPLIQATTEESWVHVTLYDNSSGYVNVSPNTGSSRTGWVRIGEATLAVVQDGVPGAVEHVGLIYTNDGKDAIYSPELCANTIASYRVNWQAAAERYTWTVTGGVILDGQGTTKINVQWGNGPSGIVEVYAANSFSQSSSNDRTITIVGSIQVQLMPDNLTVCDKAVAEFGAGASGGKVITGYQWQVLLQGSTQWANISGANGFTYRPVADALYNNTQYRCIVTGCGLSSVSNTGTLIVRPAPTMQVTLTGDEYLSSGQQGFYKVSTANPGYTVGHTWYRSGIEQVPTDDADPDADEYVPVMPLTTDDVIHCAVRIRDDYNCTSDISSNAIQVTRQDAAASRGNAIISNKVLIKGQKQITDITLENLTAEGVSQTVGYFDGLGRPIQTIQTQASPSKKDVVQPVVYDVHGREPIKYLPFVSNRNNGLYNPNAVGELNNRYSLSPHFQFYQSAEDIEHDTKPYAKAVFEDSPLNRVIKQGAPGEAWQPNGDINSTADNSVKFGYEFNVSKQVFKFDYNTSTASITLNEVVTLRYYAPNELFANKTLDEHNNEVIEFKDKEEKVVCKKVQYGSDATGKLYASTYYIYDDLDNLVVVLPPEAIKEITGIVPEKKFYNNSLSNSFTKNNCSGAVGSSVLYTVPASLYASEISQAEADQQAQNDINANGQAYADANGYCTYSSVLKSGAFTRNNCSAGQGSSIIYTVAPNRYTSIISQADADLKAQQDVNTNGQAYANANGQCIFYSTEKSGSFTRNNCLEGSTVIYVVPNNRYNSVISQDVADQQAQEDVDTNGQAYANMHGTCTYYNTEITQQFFRSDCSCGFDSPGIMYTVQANTYSSTESQQAADQLALDDLNTNGQALADTEGECIDMCTNEEYGNRLVNCECETGTLVYTSSFYDSYAGYWQCYYYYYFSDGTTTAEYSHYSTERCTY